MQNYAPHFETDEEVMFFDTDCGGVVHNLAYMRMIETCRTKLAAQIGLDLKSMMDTQQFAVIVRHEIDYIRPAVLGDTLHIKGWVSELNRATFWCDFHVTRKQTGELLVKAHQQLALVQMPSGKPIRLPKFLFSPKE